MSEAQYLFSYGTLQLESVQNSVFGRLLEGRADQLPGHKQEMLEIHDPAVIAASGQKFHPVVIRTNDPTHHVAGMVFTVSAEDLARSDAYEVSDYKRELFTLCSGTQAWVYVDARPKA